MSDSNSIANNSTQNSENADLNFLMTQYQVLADHALNQDTMMWDTPSLLFVAQSLLWSIALDIAVMPFFRCVISLVAVLISFISFQLFLRHHVLKTADDEQLHSIEVFFMKNKTTLFCPLIVHNRLEKRTLLAKNGTKLLINKLKQDTFYSRNPLAKKSSFRIWSFAFLIFGGISFLILAYNIYSCILSLVVDTVPPF